MKSIVRAAAVAALAFTSAACATVTRGTNQAWEVQTTPSGARVETSHGYFCEATPCSIRMPRESEFTATISMEGYQTQTVTVTHQTADGGAMGMAGNVVLGGVIGAVVDANSGATQELTPNPVILTLVPSQGPARGGGSGGLQNFVDELAERFGF